MRKKTPFTVRFLFQGLMILSFFIPFSLTASNAENELVLEIECPPDLTLECNGGPYTNKIDQWVGLSEVTGVVCDMAIPFTLTTDLAENQEFFINCDLSGSLTTMVTITATNNCTGETASCMAEIFLVDTQDPVITCPDDLILTCDGDFTDEVNTWLNSVQAEDDCDNALTITNNFEDAVAGIDCGASPVAVPVTFTATDDCGHSDECTATIMINEPIPQLSIECPDNLVLECDMNADYASQINAWIATVTISDDCNLGGVVANTYTQGTLPPVNCNMEEGLSVTFTATDACGGTAECQAAIIFRDDTVNPSVDCPSNLTLECGEDYQAEIDDWLAMFTAEDLCDNELTLINSFDIDDLPEPSCVENVNNSLLVSFSAFDDCDNGGSCLSRVYVIDNSGPEIQCDGIDDLVLECNTSNNYPDLINEWIAATKDALINGNFVDDVCSNGDITVEDDYDDSSIPVLSCDRTIGLAVTFTVKDECENETDCTKTVYLDDETDPVIDCTGIEDLVLECATGASYELEIEAWLADAQATILSNPGTMDACGGDLTVDNDYLPIHFPDFSCDPLAGTLVTFTLSDECGNESDCSAKIKFTDTTDPVLTCPENLFLECGDADHATQIANWLTTFTASDACDDNLVTDNDYVDGTIPDLSCLNDPANPVEVVFSAQDECNPAVTCSAFIYLVDDTDPVIDCSGVEDLVLECENGVDYTLSIEDWIANAKTSILLSASDVCDDNLTIDDNYDGVSVPTLNCDQSSGLVITFIVSDDCNNVAECNKTVFLDDTTDPVLAAAPDDVTIECGGLVPAPADLTASDLCDTDVEVVLNETTTPGDPIIIERVWTAFDECGNEDEDSQLITVEDTGPEAVCNQITVVLSSEPTVRDAVDFDGGSSSVCSAVSILARRLDSPDCENDDSTPFDTTVPFFCCDAGKVVTIELEATDAFGKKDTCSVEIPVDDDSVPVISCPPAVTVECRDCDDTGLPTVDDACDDSEITFFDSDLNNNCHTGTFIRSWIATNSSGKADTCEQMITLVNTLPFNESDISWPEDISVAGCELPQNTGEPEYQDGPCELLSHTINNEFEFSPAPGCTTRIIEWIVFDFCQDALPASECPGSVMCWTHTQTISVFNTTPPQVVCTPPDDFCSYDPECQTGEATLSITATDDCNSLLFYYKIDLNDDGTIDIALTEDDDGSVTGTYELGTHRIYWKVDDGCGNVALCDYLFTIKDCKAPDMNLHDEIVRGVMIGGMIEVFAGEWDQVNFPTTDNCGLDEDSWLIQVPTLGINQNTDNPPLTAEPSYVFTCADDNLPDLISVDIWVKDLAGNWAYLTVDVDIQDNTNICQTVDFAIVTGVVQNEEEEPVEFVQVKAEGNGQVQEMTTDADGQYAFDLPVDQNYNISAVRNDNLLNGVSTLDLILMNKHILQVETLDSPYKMIAADIDNSGYISATDIVHLRKAILYISDEFPDNTSWRFIDAAFIFPDPDNPFESPFPEILTFNDLGGDDDTRFVAVKIGDTNCSAQANSFSEGGGDRNSGEVFNFKTEEQFLEAGETYTVDLSTDDFTDLLGFQFSFFFDPDFLKFEGFEAGELPGMNTANLGLTKLNEGIITASWNGQEPTKTGTGPRLFSFVFKAVQDGWLSDLVQLNSRYTERQAYKAGRVLDIGLQFFNGSQLDITDRPELFQNFPNPFTDETMISFSLPKKGLANLVIYDISGNPLQKISRIFAKGTNVINIDRTLIKSSGVFYYQLENANHVLVKKMVIKD